VTARAPRVEPPERDAPIGGTAARVLGLEAVVILALWWIGRYFA
jgi:hypothetical protein